MQEICHRLTQVDDESNHAVTSDARRPSGSYGKPRMDACSLRTCLVSKARSKVGRPPACWTQLKSLSEQGRILGPSQNVGFVTLGPTCGQKFVNFGHLRFRGRSVFEGQSIQDKQ